MSPRLSARGRWWAGRVTGAVGLEDVVRLRMRVADLAEAVPENLALEQALAPRVTALEQALVAPLERRARELGAR